LARLPRIGRPRPRTLLAALAALAAALALGGCIAFTGPIGLQQLDVIGKVRVSFTVCATNHPDGPGGSVADHPGCDEPSNDSDQANNSDYQVLLAFRVPTGTVPPASFTSVSGEALTFTRSGSYERQLQELVPPPAGQEWVGYISNVYTYDAGAENNPAKKAAFEVDFGMPPGANGHPFAGPFSIRPVVGGRDASGGDGDSPDRPVACGDFPFGGDFGGNTNCIDSPSKDQTAQNLAVSTRDLGIGAGRIATRPGKRTTLPFTAQYAGPADPNARFSLSASTNLNGAVVTPASTTLVPGANSSNPVGVAVQVPRRAPAGNYFVTLTAKLANGQQRQGSALLRVRDGIPPVEKALAVRPGAFTPFPDNSSIARSRGARVSYRLSEAATTRFTVQRCVRRGGKCRYRRVKGGFRHKGVKGKNSFRFTGFVGRRRLAPGRYRLVGVPVDAAKNKGRAVRAGFRIRR
jgi:hypothetical protein